MTCERCGKKLAPNATVCPACGTSTPFARQDIPTPIHVTVVNTFTTPGTNKNNALLIEILCSLFGLYGIGWLIAGETVPGVILLLGSFVLLWPLAIAIAVLTLGFGIFFCDLPLTVVGIIVNAILLNSALNRKRVQYGFTTTYTQPMSPPQMPPQHMPH